MMSHSNLHMSTSIQVLIFSSDYMLSARYVIFVVEVVIFASFCYFLLFQYLIFYISCICCATQCQTQNANTPPLGRKLCHKFQKPLSGVRDYVTSEGKSDFVMCDEGRRRGGRQKSRDVMDDPLSCSLLF